MYQGKVSVYRRCIENGVLFIYMLVIEKNA